MGDGKKTCLGMMLFGAGLVFGVIAFWFGRFQIGDQAGWVLGISTFVFFSSIAGYSFYRVESWAWVPLVFSVGYAILPDLMTGVPFDDIVAVILGGVLTGLMQWRSQQRKKSQSETDLINQPK